MSVRRRVTCLGMVSLLLSHGATSLGAQSVRDAIDRGVAMYHGLAFDEALAELRRALSSPQALQLPDTMQARALAYVAAAEIHLGRIPSGDAAFREALGRAPQYRLDTLEFPPAVAARFEESRRTTSFVLARAPRETFLDVGRGAVAFHLHGSAPHLVHVALCHAGGPVARRLYQGQITDTLVVSWDGLDHAGATALVGTFELCVESLGYDGVARWLRLPLRVAQVGPSSAGVPVRAGGGPSVARRLLIGAAATASALLLPELVAPSAPSSARRYVVGSAALLAVLWRTPAPRSQPASPAAVAPTAAAFPLRLRVQALRDAARSEDP